MASKPLAVRLLEQRKVPHEVVVFDDGIRSAVEVARAAGLEPRMVYKTLVVEHDPPKGKPLLVMVPADSGIDLKVLAQAVGTKKLRMASHRDAERITGLKVGGISALALRARGFPVYLDVRAVELGEVLVSAGQRGWDVRLSVGDLVALTGAAVVRTS
jgi:Cys-tRNA(Pro)/Cys-tRNA(Cys) deacylase